MTVRLVLPLPLNLANARMHWRKKDRLRREYWTACDASLPLSVRRQRPHAPWSRVHVYAVLYVWGEMDDDNAMARCKWAVDWLKQRKWIVDDRRANIVYAGLPEQHIDRKRPRLELHITPLDGETA